MSENLSLSERLERRNLVNENARSEGFRVSTMSLSEMLNRRNTSQNASNTSNRPSFSARVQSEPMTVVLYGDLYDVVQKNLTLANDPILLHQFNETERQEYKNAIDELFSEFNVILA